MTSINSGETGRPRKTRRTKFAVFGAFIVLGFIYFQGATDAQYPEISARATTTTMPTTTTPTPAGASTSTTTATTRALPSSDEVTVSVQGIVQTAVQTATTTTTTATATTFGTAVQGVVLARTGTSAMRLVVAGVMLVMLGTALELGARRRRHV